MKVKVTRAYSTVNRIKWICVLPKPSGHWKMGKIFHSGRNTKVQKLYYLLKVQNELYARYGMIFREVSIRSYNIIDMLAQMPIFYVLIY
jgi:hypothetical protein